MLAHPTNVENAASLQGLRRRIQQMEQGLRPEAGEVFSTGCPVLDNRLPAGGMAEGTLVEWLSDEPAGDAGMLSFLAARCALGERELIVVIDSAKCFYPAAAVSCGIDPSQLVVLRPRNKPDELWAIDQALRCPGVAVVWAKLDEVTPHDGRRLQLAAENGGTLGFFLRPGRIRGQPSWASIQFFITPQAAARHRRLQVEIVRAPGGATGPPIILEMDDVSGCVCEAVEQHETHPVPSLSDVADPAAGRRPA